MLLSTLNFGEILREFWEILGKNRTLGDRSVGTIGFKCAYYIKLITITMPVYLDTF